MRMSRIPGVYIMALYCSILSLVSSHMCDLHRQRDGLKVDCSFLNISEPPDDVTGNVISLNLANNRMTSLNDDAFVSLIRLSHLILTNNYIRYIAQMVFKQTKRVRYLDLSHNNIESLTSQFRFLEDLRYLDLSYNRIMLIPENLLLTNLQLKHFDISHNSISKLYANTFNGLQNLRYLDLLYNKFCFNELSYPVGIALQSVEYLGLYSKAECAENYPYYLIETLENIRELEVTATRQFTFSSSFSQLRLLESLSFCIESCNASEITHSTFAAFANLTSLKALSLVNCPVTNLDSMAFSHFKSLQTLNVACSLQVALEQTLEAIRNIPSHLHTLVLDNTQAEDVNLHNVIKSDSFCMESLKHLKRLSIKSLHLAAMDVNFILCLRELEELSCGFNSILRVLPSNYYQRLFQLKRSGNTSVTIVDASYLGSQFFGTYIFGYCQNEKSNDVDRFFRKPPSFINESPDIKINRTIQLPSDPFDVNYRYSYYPKVIYFDHNQIFSRMLSAEFKLRLGGIWTTRLYNISHIHIPCLCFSLSGFELLKSFDASFCHTTKINIKGNFIGIRELYLSNNQLHESIETIPRFFDQTPNVRLIDLKANHLTHLVRDTFLNTLKLEKLLLGQNGFQQIGFAIAQLKSLEILDVSHNSIHSLKAEDRNAIFALENVSLNMRDNPIHCTCASTKSKTVATFIKFLQTHSKRFVQVNRYVCFDDNRQEQIIHVNTKELERKCKQSLLKSVGFWSGLILGLSLLISVILLIYTNQWRIRYHYYKLCHRRKIKKKEVVYTFDLFAFYAQQAVEDIAWIVHELHPHCQKWRTRLCFEGKDFAVGGVFAEDIVGAIDDSKKTILLVSNEFIKDGWCYFTLNMALIKGLDHIIMVISDHPKDYANKNVKLICKVLDSIPEAHRLHISQANFWKALRKLVANKKYHSESGEEEYDLNDQSNSLSLASLNATGSTELTLQDLSKDSMGSAEVTLSDVNKDSIGNVEVTLHDANKDSTENVEVTLSDVNKDSTGNVEVTLHDVNKDSTGNVEVTLHDVNKDSTRSAKVTLHDISKETSEIKK